MTEIPEQPQQPVRQFNGRLYPLRSLYLTVIVGGPLAAAYILSHNFRMMGERKKAIWTWIGLVIFFIVIVLVGELIPVNPNVIFALLALLLSVNVMNRYQEQAIVDYEAAGHLLYPAWHGLVIGLISLLLTLLLVLGGAYLEFSA